MTRTVVNVLERYEKINLFVKKHHRGRILLVGKDASLTLYSIFIGFIYSKNIMIFSCFSSFLLSKLTLRVGSFPVTS